MTPILSRLVFAGAAAVLAGGVLAKSPARPVQAQHIASPAQPKGNATNGQKLYAICMGCHSIEDNDVGPKHRGVVGRKAGNVAGYAYSSALKASGIVWTPALLDSWLQGPPKLVPGTKMFFSVARAQDRADIIAYLATQK